MNIVRGLTIGVCLAVAAMLGACGDSDNGNATGLAAPQATVDAMAGLQPTDMPQHLAQDNAERSPDDFDVNRYFTVLRHLAMEENHALDYVYDYQGIGGRPVLYARKAGAQPYLTMAQRQAAEPEAGAEAYLSYVRTDGSAEGFFELMVLRIMGPQFYLYWHAAYNDDRLLCDASARDNLLAGTLLAGVELPDEVAAAARRLDVTPQVEFSDSTVTVRVTTFSQWSGFERVTCAFGRAFPHTPRETRSEVLVAYDCGIRF